MATYALMALLFLVELRRYFSVETRHRLGVDDSHLDHVEISFDVSFPKMPCAWLTLDAMDVAGDSHLHVETDVTKYRLDRRGNQTSSVGEEVSL